MRILAWERENFRLNKGNIFPSRKSLVSDIPAEEGKTAKHFFTVQSTKCVIYFVNSIRYFVTVIGAQKICIGYIATVIKAAKIVSVKSFL